VISRNTNSTGGDELAPALYLYHGGGDAADPKGKEANEHKDQLPHVQELHKLFKVLLKARGKRGAIDFETIETR